MIENTPPEQKLAERLVLLMYANSTSEVIFTSWNLIMEDVSCKILPN